MAYGSAFIKNIFDYLGYHRPEKLSWVFFEKGRNATHVPGLPNAWNRQQFTGIWTCWRVCDAGCETEVRHSSLPALVFPCLFMIIFSSKTKSLTQHTQQPGEESWETCPAPPPPPPPHCLLLWCPDPRPARKRTFTLCNANENKSPCHTHGHSHTQTVVCDARGVLQHSKTILE